MEGNAMQGKVAVVTGSGRDIGHEMVASASDDLPGFTLDSGGTDPGLNARGAAPCLIARGADPWAWQVGS